MAAVLIKNRLLAVFCCELMPGIYDDKSATAAQT